MRFVVFQPHLLVALVCAIPSLTWADDQRDAALLDDLLKLEAPMADWREQLARPDAPHEDAPPPDKSGYTLFNPVPDDLMREFSSDRPGKSSSATTVDAGHFQYETDIAGWTYDRYTASGVTTSNLVLFDPETTNWCVRRYRQTGR